MLTGLSTTTPAYSLATRQIATHSSATVQLEPIVDEHGLQLHTSRLDEALVQQADDSAEEPIIIGIAGVADIRGAAPPERKMQTLIAGLKPGDYLVRIFQNHLSELRSRHRIDLRLSEPDSAPSLTKAPLAVPVHVPPSRSRACMTAEQKITVSPPTRRTIAQWSPIIGSARMQCFASRTERPPRSTNNVEVY